MGRSMVKSDILVIGGSGAGVMSAVTASREGAEVVLVSKGKVGKNGNAIMLGGSFGVDGQGARDVCGEADANQEYTAESLFEKMVACAFGLGNQELQKRFVEDGPYAVKELLHWVKECGSTFVFAPKACRWRAGGVAFGRALKRGLESQKEIPVYEDIMVSDLLTRDGKVCGAIGFNVYTGEIIEFRAKSVIMATRGWQPYELKNTNSDMSGDGIAMALRAGAKVKDMEFLLAIPTIQEPLYAKGSILPFQMTMPNIFPLRHKATDLDGKELPYSSEPRFKTNASNSKVKKLLYCAFYAPGMYEKWDTYGNRFYMDYSAYTDEEIRDGFRTFYENQHWWHGKDKYHHIDLQQLAEDMIANGKRLMCGFGNEYSMGGIVVNEKFETDIPGLYAAGEVTGGLFGAFRSGDGLTEMLANGLTAGKNAAVYAKNAADLEPANLDKAEEFLVGPRKKSQGVSAIEAWKKLEQISEEGFGFVRDGRRLQLAYDHIRELRASLDQLAAPGADQYNLEWINSVIIRNLALCTEIGIYSALNRKESRGCHLRMDEQQVDNENFLFSWLAELKDGELVYEKEVPIPTYLPLDTRNYPSVLDCIAETILKGEMS